MACALQRRERMPSMPSMPTPTRPGGWHALPHDPHPYPLAVRTGRGGAAGGVAVLASVLIRFPYDMVFALNEYEPGFVTI
jgi:hypothetical protein